jgi:hypothetical protein
MATSLLSQERANEINAPRLLAPVFGSRAIRALMANLLD